MLISGLHIVIGQVTQLFFFLIIEGTHAYSKKTTQQKNNKKAVDNMTGCNEKGRNHLSTRLPPRVTTEATAVTGTASALRSCSCTGLMLGSWASY